MNIRKIILFAIAALALIACNSQKKIPATPDDSNASSTQVVKRKSIAQRAIEAQPDFQTVFAQKVRFAFVYQKKNISANGTITMIKDSTCIISVQPLLGIELVRLEVSPTDIILVDKMNKRYVQLSYADLEAETGVPVTFNDVQNMLMARMFVIGQQQSFLYSNSVKPITNSTQTQLIFTEGKIDYNYEIDNNTLALTKATLAMGKKGTGCITYAAHTLFNDILFPTLINIAFNTNSIEASCELTLPNLTFNSQVNATPINLRNYKQTSLATILK